MLERIECMWQGQNHKGVRVSTDCANTTSVHSHKSKALGDNFSEVNTSNDKTWFQFCLTCLTHCGYIYRGDKSGLLPDGIKPLPLSMMAFHQIYSMAFTWAQFRMKYLIRNMFSEITTKQTLQSEHSGYTMSSATRPSARASVDFVSMGTRPICPLLALLFIVIQENRDGRIDESVRSMSNRWRAEGLC